MRPETAAGNEELIRGVFDELAQVGAFGAFGGIALLALSITFGLVRRRELATGVAAATLRAPQPEPAE